MPAFPPTAVTDLVDGGFFFLTSRAAAVDIMIMTTNKEDSAETKLFSNWIHSQIRNYRHNIFIYLFFSKYKLVISNGT